MLWKDLGVKRLLAGLSLDDVLVTVSSVATTPGTPATDGGLNPRKHQDCLYCDDFTRDEEFSIKHFKVGIKTLSQETAWQIRSDHNYEILKYSRDRVGLWDLLSTDPDGKWMSWFCGWSPIPFKGTRFLKSHTDIWIPNTPDNTLGLTAASSVYGVYSDDTPSSIWGRQGE